MKKLWPYLLLNVVISATTVLIVLLIWNAAHPSAVTKGEGDASSSSEVSQPTATLPPLDAKLFEVSTLIGAGDLENEHVSLVYLGSQSLDLHNWTLWAGKKQIYTFPSFVLFKGGGLDVYSKAGVNSAIELYINSKETFWRSGVQLSLRDPAGNVRLEYAVR